MFKKIGVLFFLLCFWITAKAHGVDLRDGYYVIQYIKNGHVLERVSEGRGVALRKRNDSPLQTWKIKKAGGNKYRISNVADGWYAGFNYRDFKVRRYIDNDWQTWTLSESSHDGYYLLPTPAVDRNDKQLEENLLYANDHTGELSVWRAKFKRDSFDETLGEYGWRFIEVTTHGERSKVTAIEEGYYFLCYTKNNKYLERASSGRGVVLSEKKENVHQKWQVKRMSDGNYAIKSAFDDMYCDYNYKNFHVREFIDNVWRLWIFTTSTDGHYFIRPAPADALITDIYGKKQNILCADNGRDVDVRTRHFKSAYLNQAVNQASWKLIRTTKPDLPDGAFFTKHLTVLYSNVYERRMWQDKGSHAKTDGSFWRIKTIPGWVRLGDTISANHNTPAIPGLLVKDDSEFLKKPVDYRLVWADHHSGADEDGSVWEPVPPPGFVALGHVAQSGYHKPSLDVVRCVKKECVSQGKFIGPLWTSFGSHCWPFAGYLTSSRNENDIGVFALAGAKSNKPFWSVVSPAFPPYALKGLAPEEMRKRLEKEGLDAYNSKHKICYDNYLKTHGRVYNEKKAAVAKAMALALTSRGHKLDSIDHAKDEFRTVYDNTKNSIQEFRNDDNWNNGSTKDWIKTEKNAHNVHHGVQPHHTKNHSNQIAAVTKKYDAFKSHHTMLFNDIPGLGKIEFLRDTEIKNIKFIQGQIPYKNKRDHEPYMILMGEATVDFPVAGKMSGRIILFSRLYIEHGIRTGFVLFTDLRTLKKRLKDLNKAPFDIIKFSDKAAVIFGNKKHAWKYAEFPEPVLKTFKTIADVKKAKIEFSDNLAILAGCGLNNNELFKPVKKILHSPPPEFLLTGLFPKNNKEKFKLKAHLLTQYNLKFFPPGLKIGTPDLELTVGANLKLISFIAFNLSPDLPIHIPAWIDIPLNFKDSLKFSLTINAKIPGEWKNPFKINGLTFKHMTVFGTIGNVAPSLGLSLDMDMGMNIGLTGGIACDSPIGLSLLGAKLPEVKFKDLVIFQTHLAKAAFPHMAGHAILPKANLPLDQFSIKNFSCTVSLSDIPAKDIYKGYSVSGDLYWENTELGSVYARFLANKGMQMKTITRKFKLGPVALTGSGHHKNASKKLNGPALDFEYRPLNKPPYNLRQHCYFSGKVQIYKAPMDVLLDLRKDAVLLRLLGKFDGFNIYVEGSGHHHILTDITQGGQMSLSGNFEQDFMDYLEDKVRDKVGGNTYVKQALDLISSSLINIKSVEFSTSLNELSQGKIASLKVKAAILGDNVTMNMDYQWSDTGSIIGKIGDRVIAIAKDKLPNFAKLWHDLKNAASKFANQALDNTNPQKAAENAQHAAADAAKNASADAQKAAENAANSAKDAMKHAWSGVSGLFH